MRTGSESSRYWNLGDAKVDVALKDFPERRPVESYLESAGRLIVGSARSVVTSLTTVGGAAITFTVQ